MNLTDILISFVAFSSALMMFASLKNMGIKSLWLWKSIGLLGLCILLRFNPQPLLLEALLVLWGVFFLLPALGFSRIQRDVVSGKYQEARSTALWLSRIHPGDGWQDYPDILHALDLVKQGKTDLAISILKRFKGATSPIAMQAMMTLFRIEGQWQDCIDWIEALPQRTHWKTSPALSSSYARALAETRNYDRFFPFLEFKIPDILKRPKDYNQLMIMAFAFSGRVPALQRLFGQASTAYLRETQAYWLATAAMTAGRMDIAQTQFQQLKKLTQDQALIQAINVRLRSPLPPSQNHISHQLHQKLEQLDSLNAPANNRYDFGKRSSGQSWITWLLVAANVAMFLVEIQRGGAENGRVLYDLGGLWPPDVWEGQYWRLITVNFLHAGMTHLGMNMMGLLILGSFVERVMGWFRFCLIYGLSGLGAALGITYLPLWLNYEPEFTVGASGAIMGLVGAIAAITLWGWLVERVSIAARRFRTVLFMVGIQMVFDFTMPQISITGHLTGLVVGFFITLLVILLLGFKKETSASLV